MKHLKLIVNSILVTGVLASGTFALSLNASLEARSLQDSPLKQSHELYAWGRGDGDCRPGVCRHIKTEKTEPTQG